MRWDKDKIMDKIAMIDIEIWYKELEKKKYQLKLNQFKAEKIWFKTD